MVVVEKDSGHFMGFSNRLKVVWESKGSISAIAQEVITQAKIQKTKERADIRFVSLATLKSDKMSEVSLEDPLSSFLLEGNVLERKLSRVMHYVNAFNFIGQAELSRYFRLLGKRLERDRNFPEFDEKLRLFKKIRRESVRVAFAGKVYLGNIEQTSSSRFLYVGFDERLLTVQGCMHACMHNNVINLLGIKPNSSQVAILIIAESQDKASWILNTISKSLLGKRDDSVIELLAKKFDGLRKLFRISNIELKAKTERKGAEKEALLDLIIEHMALLACER